MSKSAIFQTLSILFAWVCWALAYIYSNIWLVPISFIPYFISNRFGHLLDKD